MASLTARSSRCCTRWAPSAERYARPSHIPLGLNRSHLAAATRGVSMTEPVYVVLVVGKVKPGRMAEFKEYFKPLADHVTAHEPGCLTYQLSVGADDPDSLCIYERYVSKDYLENIHWKSEPFQMFGAKVRAADLWESKAVTKLWEEAPGSYGYHSK